MHRSTPGLSGSATTLPLHCGHWSMTTPYETSNSPTLAPARKSVHSSDVNRTVLPVTELRTCPGGWSPPPRIEGRSCRRNTSWTCGTRTSCAYLSWVASQLLGAIEVTSTDGIHNVPSQIARKVEAWRRTAGRPPSQTAFQANERVRAAHPLGSCQIDHGWKAGAPLTHMALGNPCQRRPGLR